MYGEHKLDTCYPYQLVNRNETFIRFTCEYPVNADRDFNTILGMLFIILALCILIGCSMKWNLRNKKNLEVNDENKKVQKQLLLNTQYQTFK